MKFKSFFLAAMFASLFSNVVKGDCCDLFSEASLSWDIGAGYRQDNLKWTFHGFSPGEAIHESWDNINIGFIETNVKACFCENYLFKFDFDYGWSGWGKHHHAKLEDYNSAETTHRPKTDTKAEVYDVSLGFGYPCWMNCSNLMITPLIGWSFSHQRFNNPNFYSKRHERSHYSWSSGWLGFDILYQFCCPLAVYLDYEFHLGDFHSTVDEFFRHHHHNRHFYGNEVEIGIDYQFCSWFSTLKFNYKDYRAERSSSFGAFEGGDHHKGAEWWSYSVALDLGCNF